MVDLQAQNTYIINIDETSTKKTNKQENTMERNMWIVKIILHNTKIL